MIVIRNKLGSIDERVVIDRVIDYVSVEWFERNKRILHKITTQGKELTLKFLDASPALTDGDILYEDDISVIVVNIAECDCIIIQPNDMKQMAEICYEIGNRHLPLFYTNNELMVAFEEPLSRWLDAAGFNVLRDERKLMHPLKSTVLAEPHLSPQLLITKSNS